MLLWNLTARQMCLPWSLVWISCCTPLCLPKPQYGKVKLLSRTTITASQVCKFSGVSSWSSGILWPNFKTGYKAYIQKGSTQPWSICKNIWQLHIPLSSFLGWRHRSAGFVRTSSFWEPGFCFSSLNQSFLGSLRDTTALLIWQFLHRLTLPQPFSQVKLLSGCPENLFPHLPTANRGVVLSLLYPKRWKNHFKDQ